MKRIISVLLVALMTTFIAWAQRKVETLNFGWEFSRDASFKNSITIDVPHDFQISQPWIAPSAGEKADNSDAAANIKSRLSARGFKEIGAGWYRRVIMPANDMKGRRVVLDFDGIMLTGDVYLNGQRIGGTDYGYVGFQIDITNRLKYGQANELMVKAETQDEKASRWYTGGGLFRDVTLITTKRTVRAAVKSVLALNCTTRTMSASMRRQKLSPARRHRGLKR